MPRYDDRSDGTRLYVGHLSSRTRSRELEDVFSRYGRVRDVDMKHDFAFIDFSDPRDADDARHSLNGRDVGGSRIVVEFARGAPRGRGSSREYLGRGPPPGSGRCFNCGIDGHWARDCKTGDSKNKCYRCGERGHVERNCKNSPKSLRRGRSYSRSPSPRRGRRRSQSYSRSRSYSQSRSPPRRGGQSVERDERSRSPDFRRTPSPPPSRGQKIIPSEKGKRSRSPEYRRTPSPPPSKGQKISPSERGKRSRSPVYRRTPSPPPSRGHKISPSERGKRSRSPVYRRTPSPPPSRGQKISPTERGKRSRSPEYRRSPSPPPSKLQKITASPGVDGSPQKERSPAEPEGSDFGLSPTGKENSRSPSADPSYVKSDANGGSPAPQDYPRGSESPDN